jgi:hypothetical protein
MKRFPFVIVVALGSVMCGLLICRRSRGGERRGQPEPMDRFQEGVRLDLRVDYRGAPEPSEGLEKLRIEEVRQRPQEARN